MAQRERFRERQPVFEPSAFQRKDFDDVKAKPIPPPLQDEDSMHVDDNDDGVGGGGNAGDFTSPAWLLGLFPIPWTSADGCSQKQMNRSGKACCLFYPLGYCRDTDIVNGFCVYHLRSIFNVVYQTDCVFSMNAQGKPVVSQRTACYVAVPQIVNDRYTSIFPLMELMPMEISIEDIKMHNLIKHLRLQGTKNWERVYANHVNYLYRLLTLYMPRQNHQTIETRVDQATTTQLIMHWNQWNEYYTRIVLQEQKANLNLCVVSDSGDEVRTIPIGKCTTITQMVARLFSVPYTNLNEYRFFSTVPSYGVFTRAHWSYCDNLCGIGTYCSKGGLQCIGNLATASVLRMDNDACSRTTIHYTKSECESEYCVPSNMKLDAPSLNQTAVVSTVPQFTV